MNSPKSTKLVLKHPTRKGVSTLADLANEYEEMDKLVQTTSLNELRRLKPGPAEHNLFVEIHTTQAYGLILGRSRKHQLETFGKDQASIMGLFGFVKQTSILINTSLNGDPFADVILLKIEEYLQKFDEHISASVATVEQMIKNLSENGIKTRRMSSKTPAKVNILFTSPYGMKLLMLIVKYDHLARLYLPIRQLQILDHDTWSLPFNEARNIFRKMMNITTHYVDAGLTRENIQNATPQIKKHITKMSKFYGQLPDDVLDYQKRPALIYTYNFRNSNRNDAPEKKANSTNQNEIVSASIETDELIESVNTVGVGKDA